MGMFTEFVISTETLKIASQLSSLGLWQEHHNRLCPAFDAGVAKSERFSCLAVHDDSSFRLFKGAPAAPDLSVLHFSDGRELQRIELMKKKAAGQRRLAEHQKGLLEHQARSLKWAEAFERHAAIVDGDWYEKATYRARFKPITATKRVTHLEVKIIIRDGSRGSVVNVVFLPSTASPRKSPRTEGEKNSRFQ